MESMNTQSQVNQRIVEEISQHLKAVKNPAIMDLPCGNGSFLQFLSEKFHATHSTGIEIERFPTHEALEARKNIHFLYTDLSKPFNANHTFDIITSVSGVMEFENTSLFLEQCFLHLKSDGTLFLTNDNIATIRDRFSFLFFGKFKRFAMNLWPGFSTYKAISVQELYKMLKERGFEIEKVVYTDARFEDWLFLPLALLLYPFQAHYIFWEKSPMPRKIRFELFPLRSLICRHYFFVARKKEGSS